MKIRGYTVYGVAAVVLAACGSTATEPEAIETEALSREDMLRQQCQIEEDVYACAVLCDLTGSPIGCEPAIVAGLIGGEETIDVGDGMPTPTPEVDEDATTLVPAGFEDVFPVTIEYKDEGWSFAQTFYGGADLLGFSKAIENSPPGKAELVVTYSVIPQPDEDAYLIADVGEPVSLDDGRTPPRGVGEDRPEYWLHFDGEPSETNLVWFTDSLTDERGPLGGDLFPPVLPPWR